MKAVAVLAGLFPRPLFSVTRVKRPLLFVLSVCVKSRIWVYCLLVADRLREGWCPEIV